MSTPTAAALAGAALIVALFALAPDLGLDRTALGEEITRALSAGAMVAWAAWLIEANRRRGHWQYRLGRDLRARGRGWAGASTAALILAALFLVGSGSAVALSAGVGAAMLLSAQLLPH